jgi:hypothetical protein
VDSGPTTVGSIVGKLKMDRDQWAADVQRTKSDARELGSLEPKIKIDADVAAALAKLEQVRRAAEAAGVHTTSSVTATSVPASGSASTGAAAKVDAVAAAERRLALAVSASESATARAIVAEMKFDEQRDKHGRTAAQVAAAELALSEAVKRADNAATRATLAEDTLAAAQRKAAESALAKAAAEETATAATVKANEANSTNVSRTGMIAAAVAALVPMLVPLAAFTIGAAGALTLMGISGIIAVKGIHDEMAAGTTMGQEYTAGIRGLKGDLDVLAHTGAVSMLSSFKTATGDLNNSMPMLNRQVGEFTGFLGRSATNVFAGSLQGARVLEPLMMSISGWVERLSAGFKSWTGNGGLQTFANYAMATLPQVETFLGAVSTAIMHILEALAPLGTVGLAVFTGISGAINGIPVQVLGDLIAALLAGWAAFKLWGLVAPILATVATSMEAVGAAAYIATGPIGWIAAGVSALVAVFAVSVASTQQATAVTDAYTNALKADSGALGENVRAQAIQQLMTTDALDAGKKLGISAKTVTDATLGNADALKVYSAAISGVQDKIKGHLKDNTTLTAADKVQTDAINTLRGAVDGNSASLQKGQGDYKLYQEALGKTTTATDTQGQSVDELARKYGMTTSQYIAAKDSQSKTADQLAITTQAMFVQGDAAGLLKLSLDLLNGNNISAAAAQNAFDSAIANSNTHINAAGKEINRADTLLQGMTASAVANRTELTNQASTAQVAAEGYRGMKDAAGNLVHTQEEVRQKLIDSKQVIIDNAIANGENADEVHAYVDQLFQIPASIPPTRPEFDAAQASADLASYQFKLGQIPTLLRTVMTVDQVMGTGVGVLKLPGSSDGSTVGGSGSSGVDSVPMMLAPGEEIISNKQGQADRARPLLKAINAGIVPSSVMAGAVAAAPASAGSGGGDVHVSIINKAGAAIGDLIDLHIETASGRRKVDLSTGMQRVAF